MNLFLLLSEDSIYETYFHLMWCSDSCRDLQDEKSSENVNETLVEELFKKSIDHLLKHLQLINLSLLESITLIHTLKQYVNSNEFVPFNFNKPHPVPEGRDPCIWSSTGKHESDKRLDFFDALCRYPYSNDLFINGRSIE